MATSLVLPKLTYEIVGLSPGKSGLLPFWPFGFCHQLGVVVYLSAVLAERDHLDLADVASWANSYKELTIAFLDVCRGGATEVKE